MVRNKVKESGEPVPPAKDRAMVSEAPLTPGSAQGAANVVQTYFALIEFGRLREAYALWSDGGKASGLSADQFAASFSSYRTVHGKVGSPGATEGAAGSLYVSVPVEIYGTLRSGADFTRAGDATLRRVNDVPGSTAEQRAWHIVKIDWSTPPPAG